MKQETTLQQELDARYRATMIKDTLKTLAILAIIGLALLIVFRKQAEKFISMLPPEKYLSSGPTLKSLPINESVYRSLQQHEVTITAPRNGREENFTGIPLKFLFEDPAGPGFGFVFEKRDNLAIRYRAGGHWCTSETNALSAIDDSKGDYVLLVRNPDGSFAFVAPMFFPLDGGFNDQVERLDILRYPPVASDKASP